MPHADTEAVFYEQGSLHAEMDVTAGSAYFEKKLLSVKKDWLQGAIVQPG